MPIRSSSPAPPKAGRSRPTALTYVFHLRPDGRWSNGDPVTAADFVFALRRAVLPQTAAADISPISHIVDAVAINSGAEKDPAKLGVDAVDPLTLRIRLTVPQVTLPLYMSETDGMPLHRASYEQWGETWTRAGASDRQRALSPGELGPEQRAGTGAQPLLPGCGRRRFRPGALSGLGQSGDRPQALSGRRDGFCLGAAAEAALGAREQGGRTAQRARSSGSAFCSSI